MSENAISQLRQRMLEDMSLRGFTPGTLRDYEKEWRINALRSQAFVDRGTGMQARLKF